MSLGPIGSLREGEQTLGIAKEWTLDCDVLLEREKLDRVFHDSDTVQKMYGNIFSHVRSDLGIRDPDVTKIYVERINVFCEEGNVFCVIRYDDTREGTFIIGKVKTDEGKHLENGETIGILRYISDVKEGGGKWNAYNDLSAFWRGFLSGWKEKIEKIGIQIDPENSPPISLVNADIPPRISLIHKDGREKTIITEKKPRDAIQVNMPEDVSSDIGVHAASRKVTDILVNGKDRFENTPQQKTHTLLGILYHPKSGPDIQERARGYLEKVLLSSSTLTFNSELPELGGILQAIIDAKILRPNTTKTVKNTLARLKLHLLECEIFTHREKADKAFLEDTHESARAHEKLMDDIAGSDYRPLNSIVGSRRKSFIEGRYASTEEHVQSIVRVRNDLVCSSIEHIVLVMSTLNEEKHRTSYCDMLVTSGQYGMAGLCSMYDYRVISSSKVIEGSAQEKMLIDTVQNSMRDAEDEKMDFVRHDTKDTTGCGDVSMAAWLSGKLEIGKQLRESQYYEIFKIIGKYNDISAEQYRRAIAIAEAYWRMCFTRTMSGLMFRSKAPNMSFITSEAMENAMKFVSFEVRNFMFKELADFVHGNKHISDNGFFHLHAIAKMNRTGGRGSLEILCEREGISAEDIVMRQGNLLELGIQTTDEAFRRAKAQLLHEKWGWKASPECQDSENLIENLGN